MTILAAQSGGSGASTDGRWYMSLTRLAMTWRDKISFVLTENLSIKRISPLDVLKEDSDVTSKNDDERFDGDFMLMTGEVSKLLADLIEALGGQLKENDGTTALAA